MDSAVTSFKVLAPARENAHWSRWAEMVGGFLILPVVVGLWVAPAWWIPALWLIAFAGWLKLRRGPDPASDSEFWGKVAWREKAPELRRMIERYLVCAGALMLALIFWSPERLFDFPKKDAILWLAIMILYPVFSVYPQELLYRKYFFRRFGPLFRNSAQLAWASAVVFSWMHVIFRNEFALALTFIGGWFFADTYRRTRSLRLACLEHALYGNLAFTIGLGNFIYHGAVRL